MSLTPVRDLQYLGGFERNSNVVEHPLTWNGGGKQNHEEKNFRVTSLWYSPLNAKKYSCRQCLRKTICPNCIWVTNSIRKTLCSLTCKNDYTITGLTPRPTPAFRTYVDGGTLYDTSDSTHPTSTASQLTLVAPRELSVSEARAEGSTTVAMTRKVSLLRAAASTPAAPAGEPLAQDLIPNIC